MRVNPYSAEEVEIIKKGYENQIPTKEIALKLGRSWEAIIKKAKTLGLMVNPNFNGNDYWSDKRKKELEYLINKGHTSKEVAEILGITKNMVIGMSNRLKKKKGMNIKNTEENAQNIKEHKCQYPFGDATKGNFRFCGYPVLPGKPYCASHCAVCYVVYKKEKDLYQKIEKDLKKLF